MKPFITLMMLIIIGQLSVTAEAASTRSKYIANCVKFSQRVNPLMQADATLQKEACSCICGQVEAIGAKEEDLKTIMKYTREYDFSALPKRPSFEQILQAHVDVHRELIKTQDDLEIFVKGMMSCSSKSEE